MTAAESGYGWSSDRAPHSCGYLAPVVTELLLSIGAQRIIDLGSGNGQLCSIIKGASDAHVAGLEMDADGVALARHTYPDIPFYQQSLAEGADAILDAEGERFELPSRPRSSSTSSIRLTCRESRGSFLCRMVI